MHVCCITPDTTASSITCSQQQLIDRLRVRATQLEQAEREWPRTDRYHELRCLQQRIESLERDPYQTPPVTPAQLVHVSHVVA
jgi:hypothetical protein